MAGNYTRRINLYINGMQVRNDIKSINAEMIRLSRTTRTLEVGSMQYNRNMRRIRLLNGIISEHNAKLRITQLNLTTLKGLANAFNKYWPVVMGTVGAFAGLVMGTRRASEEFTEFDDKITDVMKVTGKTREEVIALNEQLKGFDTKTAQNDLLDLMWVAGKLGITANKDLLGFVKAADVINVSLAKDLGGNAEEAVRAIGKAVEIFDLSKVYGIEEAMIRVGSAVNDLGMASVAQEGYLIKFVERVAGIAPLAGVSIQNILGLAGALDIYGQKSEVSATAYSKLMSKMATETESIAKIMGMSIEDYVTLFTNDANEAMLQLFESLKGEGTASFTTLVQLLGETDLEGQRMTQVMGTLVQKVQRIREQQEISNNAFAKGVSVTNEFNLKNNNAKAILEKKQKAIKNLRVELGERLLPVYLSMLSVSEKFILVMTEVVEWIFRNARALVTLVTAIVAYRVVLATTNALQATQIVLTGTVRVVVLALTVAYNRLTGNIIRAAAATKLLGIAMKSTPIGMVVGAIAAVVAALFAYISMSEKAIELESAAERINKNINDQYYDKEAKIRLLTKAIENENIVLAYRKTALEELKTIVPDYIGWLDDEGKLHDHNTTAITNYMTEFKKMLRLQASKDEYAQLYTRQREVSKELGKLQLERLQVEEDLKKNEGKLTDSFRKTIFFDIDNKIQALSDEYNQISADLGSIENEINLDLVTPPPPPGGGGGGGGGDGKTPADYSEDAEIQARIAAKRKYQKGIIATEIDLQTTLDKIALRFMQGRLSQMDKDADKRAELQEKIVDKQIEIANDNQKRLDAIYEAGVELSPVQREQLNFNNELKKLNIFHKQKKDFTTNEYLAYEVLAKQHQQNLDKLDAAAIKEEFDRRQNAFENNLSRIKLQHIAELDQVTTYDQAMDILRETHTAKELKDIKTLNQAKLKIQEDQQKEEADLSIEYFNELRTELLQLMEAGALDGISLADNIMSQEEWAALKEIIDALIKKLQQLKKVKKDGETDDDPEKKNLTLKGKFRTDILGFTVDDWEAMFDNLKEGKELTESFAMAGYALANAWSDVNAIIANSENAWLQGYEKKINERKKLLENQLEAGIISHEYYNYQVEKSEEELEKKKIEIARKQAIRDKAVATFSAIINTATAFTLALAKGGLMLAAIVAAAGALQIGVIASTPLPQAEGYEEGGFIDVARAQDNKRFRARHNPKKRGWITQPTVLTGEKPGSREYVIPDEAMDNPSIAPLIEMLEMARISHNLKTVDLSTAIPAMPGRQSGGFLYQNPSTRKPEPGTRNPEPKTQNQEPITQLYGAINTLNQILASGDIKTKLVYQDLRKMQEKVQAIEDNSFI